jgi:CheY-like chemotaxis protein
MPFLSEGRMRIRVLARPHGEIEDVALEHFRIGGVYELRTDLACLFLAEGWAELVGEDDTALFVRPPSRSGADVHPLVLVVDDDAAIRKLTESLLTANGYDVLIAADGRDAIARLRLQIPDVIVLDLNMPVMDGWQFRTQQRFLTESRRAAIPVLLMTGVADAADQAVKLAAVGLVKKPIDPDDLLEAVSMAVASHGSAPDGIGPAWSRRTRRS